MTATIASFDGTDDAAAIIAISNLNVASGDFVVSWRTNGNIVKVARILPS